MKLVLWIPCVLIGIAGTLSSASAADDRPARQGFQISTPSDSSLDSVTKTDTVKSSDAVDSSFVAIAVDSIESGSVDVMLILKTRTRAISNATLLVPVNPDTIGRWNTPLFRLVPSGFYDILLHREGFKDFTKSMYPFTEKRDSLFIPFASIQRRRELFGTLKWISAGIAFAATGAAIVIRQRIRTNQWEYNNTTSPDVIRETRSTIEVNRANYKSATSAICGAIAGFAVLWVVEISI